MTNLQKVIKNIVMLAILIFALGTIAEAWFVPPTTPGAPPVAKLFFCDDSAMDVTYIMTGVIKVQVPHGVIIIPTQKVKSIWFKGWTEGRLKVSHLSGMELLEEVIKPNGILSDYINLESGRQIEGIVLNTYLDVWDSGGLHHKVLIKKLISLTWEE